MTELAKFIDHTSLKPDVKEEEILSLCKEAKENNFAAVCVNPTWVEKAVAELQGTDVKVATVVGFPLGANTPETKAFEAQDAVNRGAHEIDMVINIGQLKSGNNDHVERDIKAVVEAVNGKAIVKVIIETSLLNDSEKESACKLSVSAGAHFVKTSTGFSGGGATVEDVKLMREAVGPNIGVKASGGIRDRETAVAVVEAGATRIGASSGVAIVKGEKGTSGY